MTIENGKLLTIMFVIDFDKKRSTGGTINIDLVDFPFYVPSFEFCPCPNPSPFNFVHFLITEKNTLC